MTIVSILLIITKIIMGVNYLDANWRRCFKRVYTMSAYLNESSGIIFLLLIYINCNNNILLLPYFFKFDINDHYS